MNKSIEVKKNLRGKEILSWVWVFIGTLFVAVSIVVFTAPYNIVPGGVYGTGIILNYVFPSLKVGTYGLMMDVPLMISYFYFFGGKAGAKTVFAALTTPLVMNLMQTYIGDDPALMFGGSFDMSNDMLLTSLFGAVIMGIGLGLIFNNGGTSGGTDIIAMFMNRYFKMPLAKAIMYIESVIILIGAIVIGDWRLPLYSLVFIFVLTKIIDYLVGGAGTDKLMFIISNEHDKIKEHILFNIDRGGTYIKAKGMYTGDDKEMVFVVVSRNQVGQMRKFVKSVDETAFMVVVDANETLGDGFREF
ncbi:MAG: YitT family protein [Bacteroidetes bacterium]|nr:YitT family protein [Bacteroidota bacterium]